MNNQIVIKKEINYLEIIGKNIRRLRGDVSQDELAKKARIGRSTLSAIENGKAISLDKLLKIAKALNIHPADLFISEKDIEEVTYKHKLLIQKFTEFLNLK